jgi:DNA-binding transcriptional MerR regulator
MKIRQAAAALGISPDTLRRWEREGLINSERTPLGDRIFTPEKIAEIQQVIRSKSMERGKK